MKIKIIICVYDENIELLLYAGGMDRTNKRK